MWYAFCTAANPGKKNGRTAVLGDGTAAPDESLDLDNDEALMQRIKDQEAELADTMHQQVTRGPPQIDSRPDSYPDSYPDS